MSGAYFFNIYSIYETNNEFRPTITIIVHEIAHDQNCYYDLCGLMQFLTLRDLLFEKLYIYQCEQFKKDSM